MVLILEMVGHRRQVTSESKVCINFCEKMAGCRTDWNACHRDEGTEHNASFVVQKHAFNKDVIRDLLAWVPAATTLFRLMSSWRRLPTSLVPTLVDLGQVELAFHLSVCNQEWDLVVDIYSHPISFKSRLTGITQILLRSLWSVLIQLFERSMVLDTEFCTAFDIMIKKAQFQFAIRLLKLANERGGDVRIIPVSKVLAAIGACFRVRDQTSALRFLQVERSDPRNAVLTQFAEYCQTTDTVPQFLNTLAPFGRYIHSKLIKRMLIGVLRSKGFDSMLNITIGFVGYCYGEQKAIQTIQRLATEAIKETNDRQLLQQIRSILVNKCDLKNMCSSIVGMTNTEIRKIFGPILEAWFDLYVPLLLHPEEFFKNIRENLSNMYEIVSVVDLLILTDDLFKDNCHNLSFCLCMVLHYWSTAKRISSKKSLNSFVCFHGFLESIIAGKTELIVILSRQLQMDFIVCERWFQLRDEIVSERIPFIRICEVISLCEYRRVADWGLLIATIINNRQFISFLADKCSDTEELAYSLMTVGCKTHLQAFIPFVIKNRHPNVLHSVLTCLLMAIEDVGAVGYFLRLLDPCLVACNDHMAFTLLGNVLFANPAGRKKTLSMIIQTGVSTREHSNQPCHRKPSSRMPRKKTKSAMKIAVANKDLCSIKLLYKAAATTNRELFTLVSDVDAMDSLRNEGHDDIVRYLREKASTVRSLRDLSRQSVSHLIGCRPGRFDRVQSLGLSRDLNEFLMFEDCLTGEDCSLRYWEAPVSMPSFALREKCLRVNRPLS